MLALAAISLALVIAAWMTDSSVPSLASAALPGNSDRINFEDRFIAEPSSVGVPMLRPLKRSVLATAEHLTSTAREALASRWMPEDFRPAITDDEPRAVETKPAGTAGIPLPRSRPALADQVAQPAPATAPSLALADASRRHLEHDLKSHHRCEPRTSRSRWPALRSPDLLDPFHADETDLLR